MLEVRDLHARYGRIPVLHGVSFALGAFFAGMVMRESEFSHRAAEESLPLRDAFSVLFFVSVGMLFVPGVLVEQPLQVLAVVAIIIFGKSLAAMLLVLAFRYPLNTALTVAASLAQAATEGRLTARADTRKHQGAYRNIVQGVNDTLATMVGFMDNMPDSPSRFLKAQERDFLWVTLDESKHF